jgi:hypothetical protein
MSIGELLGSSPVVLQPCSDSSPRPSVKNVLLLSALLLIVPRLSAQPAGLSPADNLVTENIPKCLSLEANLPKMTAPCRLRLQEVKHATCIFLCAVQHG